VQIFREQKGFPQLAYTFPASGTPVIMDGIAVVRGAPHEEEARKFYEFVTRPDSLAHAAQKYYRIPVRADIDRTQLPQWMNEPFPRMALDWDLLRKEGGEWLRYWDTEIRGRSK
jgi:iron(III) transport system substrate-binding protein